MRTLVAGVIILPFFVLAFAGCEAPGNRSAAETRDIDHVTPVVASRSEQHQWTGVAVDQMGRVFVNFPRWGEPYRHAVEEINLATDARRAYPDEAWNAWQPGEDPGSAFVCVQSVHVDARQRLWILDPASPGFGGVVPGGAKLVEIDLERDEPVRTISFDATVAPEASYLNDIRIDEATDTAFITDSGLGAIVVIELATGKMRRRLTNHASTKAEPGVVPIVGGRGWRVGGSADGPVPQVHADGIALDRENRWVYWQALTGRTLYRAPMALLGDLSISEERLALAVERVAETVVSDGMIADRLGNLYFTALERDAVVVRTPRGELQILAQGPEIAWPDSFALGPGPQLWLTTSQIHRMPAFTGSDAPPDTPYLLLRLALPEASIRP
ncbi:MAG: hypothetical protein JSV80_14375 [Acidobacteriota bacterium]|nr:MAG: hypothetical protein JSV80_14375 [Acidobacteriota bacterium]